MHSAPERYSIFQIAFKQTFPSHQLITCWSWAGTSLYFYLVKDVRVFQTPPLFYRFNTLLALLSRRPFLNYARSRKNHYMDKLLSLHSFPTIIGEEIGESSCVSLPRFFSLFLATNQMLANGLIHLIMQWLPHYISLGPTLPEKLKRWFIILKLYRWSIFENFCSWNDNCILRPEISCYWRFTGPKTFLPTYKQIFVTVACNSNYFLRKFVAIAPMTLLFSGSLSQTFCSLWKPRL